VDIKTQKKSKSEDKACDVCNLSEKTGQAILTCWYFSTDELTTPLTYDMFYAGFSDMIMVANGKMKKLKMIQSILDNG
jgi:hypothetical protein